MIAVSHRTEQLVNLVSTYCLHLGTVRAEVVALSDAQVPVGVLFLEYTVCRVCDADGKDGCTAVGILCLPGVLFGV